MPIRGKAITESRVVSVIFGTVDGGGVLTADAMPIDAFKAAMGKVELVEAAYAKNPAAVSDLTAVSTFITGALPFQGYAFNVTTVMATGVYTFDFVEVRPNATNDIS